MRRHITHSLILTATLALSAAPALQAQGNGYQQPYSNSYDNHRHTIFPDAGHLNRVSAIAHEIDETATAISRQYSRNNRRPDRDEYRALERLRGLSSVAAHFHDQVESYQRDPRHTADDFARLEQAFYSADRSLSRIAPRPYVDNGMNRIHDLMNELGGYYGHHAGYYGAWGHDHDRYDHDRDHDRDHGYDHDHDNGYRPPHHR
jgi:hypothetical protein